MFAMVESAVVLFLGDGPGIKMEPSLTSGVSAEASSCPSLACNPLHRMPA